MKILTLTSSFPSHENSYAGNFILDLVRNLSLKGISSVINAPHFPKGKCDDCWGRIHIHRFRYFLPTRFERLASGSGFMYTIRKDFLAYVEIIPFCLAEFFSSLLLVRKQKVDVIHSHWLVPQGLVGALLHQITGIPHIATVHGSDMNVLKKNRILHPVCRFITRNSAVITVNSSYMKRQLLAVSPECERKVQVIPMGIDLEQFSITSIIEMKQRHAVGHLILSIGRLIDWKGTKFLIRAMPMVLEKFPDTKLLIAGEGPERDILNRYVHELALSDRVELLGTVPAADLPSYYRSADVFVLPSINYAGKTEGLGIVLLEAMASGCPVIGSNVGGIPDIITDGENGLLVPEQDPVSLAEKIICILSDTELQQKFRKNGYARVQDSFTWEKISNQFSEVYNNLLQNK